jgi:putative SOS response-associated peptidase YedK
MCGRFTLTIDPAELQDLFQEYSFPDNLAIRYNISPTQPILAIPNDGKNQADYFVWGLIPSWSKDPSIGAKLINARAETLAEKPSFRANFKGKRCLILADGFYEWKVEEGSKTKIPHYIYMKDHKPFAFAGLWDNWKNPDGKVIQTCTIITTEPNTLMSKLHNRMPVILEPKSYEQWLDSMPQTADALNPLLKPFSAEKMAAHPVSTLVNKPANDRPELVLPA